jgi:hypothetical protein
MGPYGMGSRVQASSFRVKCLGRRFEGQSLRVKVVGSVVHGSKCGGEHA